MKLIDITGQKFGRLTVLTKLPPRPSRDGGSAWRCQCDCGNECDRTSSSLRMAGSTPSCGCYQIEWSSSMGSNAAYIAARSKSVTKHGHKVGGKMSPEYKTWLGMKRRCSDPKCKGFCYYGARGIVVCERWDRSFIAFYSDMGPKPSPVHTIDRKNENGNYEPSNCCWIPHVQQMTEHHSGVVPVTIGALKFKNTADACRHFGIGATTVNERLKAGRSIEEAFTPGPLPSRRTRESYLRKNLR